MKKLLLVLAVSGCACLAQADTMSFITVLSSPVGSFNKLETADPSLPAYGKAVNFCTQVGNGGVVELKGTQSAELGKSGVSGGGMYLSSGTTLGKTDQGKFSLNNIALRQGGNITGGRIFANTVTVNNAAAGKAGNLYGNTLTLAGAKTKTLNVNSGASQITAQHDGADMAWSNEYQDDAACKTGSACAKQYLLKSKGGSAPCANEKARTYWNGSACVCPSAGRPSPVGYLSEYDICCYLDGEKKEPCWKWGPSAASTHWSWTETNSSTESCVIDTNMGYIGAANCPTCTKTCDSRIAVGVGCVEDTPSGGYHGSTGEGCVLSCDVRDSGDFTGSNCPYGHTCRTRTVTKVTVHCLNSVTGGEYSWQPQWLNK